METIKKLLRAFLASVCIMSVFAKYEIFSSMDRGKSVEFVPPFLFYFPLLCLSRARESAQDYFFSRSEKVRSQLQIWFFGFLRRGFYLIKE